MTYSPIAYAESLRIGSLDFVSPDELRVLLEVEAPDAVALNTGDVRAFPRINGYLLIPTEQGHLVAQIEWITVERSQYPKRRGMQDFGLVDLPYPLRKMSLNPLGTLVAEGRECLRFRRGVESFPTIGDPVLLPTQKQLRAIVESGDARRVKIGTSPLAANATVSVDPDRLFGRHLAVLGNTGSGKSCSVAGLIRWSLEAARKSAAGREPNARFIVLDPNGEYGATFEGLGNVRKFAVAAPDGAAEQLLVPLWLWNGDEWSAFSQASGRAQRPLLRRALREMRLGGKPMEDSTFVVRRRVSSILVLLRGAERSGEHYEGWKVGGRLDVFVEDLVGLSQVHAVHQQGLTVLASEVKAVADKRRRANNKGFNDFTAKEFDDLAAKLEAFLEGIGGVVYQEGPNEDVPLAFDGARFVDHLEVVAQGEKNPQFFDFLIARIRTLLADTRVREVTLNTDVALADWLQSYIGADGDGSASVTVVDLSLVPAEVVHVLAAVIARITLEALQRHRKLNAGVALPTVLVMEEAHTFVKRYAEDAENATAGTICSQVFEKIAREGRKFGLGLVLSSQRPSELSPTVLSQCNTFLLHRISNDRDQELVQRLVPDNLRGLLRDVPSLPSRHAILLGWASELPVLVQMNHLDDEHQPRSKDPDFWKVWSRESPRPIDWKKVADDWQQVGAAPKSGEVSAKGREETETS